MSSFIAFSRNNFRILNSEKECVGTDRFISFRCAYFNLSYGIVSFILEDYRNFWRFRERKNKWSIVQEKDKSWRYTVSSFSCSMEERASYKSCCGPRLNRYLVLSRIATDSRMTDRQLFQIAENVLTNWNVSSIIRRFQRA